MQENVIRVENFTTVKKWALFPKFGNFVEKTRFLVFVCETLVGFSCKVRKLTAWTMDDHVRRVPRGIRAAMRRERLFRATFLFPATNVHAQYIEIRVFVGFILSTGRTKIGPENGTPRRRTTLNTHRKMGNPTARCRSAHPGTGVAPSGYPPPVRNAAAGTCAATRGGAGKARDAWECARMCPKRTEMAVKLAIETLWWS